MLSWSLVPAPDPGPGKDSGEAGGQGCQGWWGWQGLSGPSAAAELQEVASSLGDGWKEGKNGCQGPGMGSEHQRETLVTSQSLLVW